MSNWPATFSHQRDVTDNLLLKCVNNQMPHRTGGGVVQPQSVSIIGRQVANLGRGSILHNVLQRCVAGCLQRAASPLAKRETIVLPATWQLFTQLRTPSLVWSVLQIPRAATFVETAANVGRVGTMPMT